MHLEDNKNQLFRQLRMAILQFDDQLSARLSHQVLKSGLDPKEAILEGLAAGMSDAGARYQEGEYFVPELLLCSDALYAGLDILRPHLRNKPAENASGKILLGVMEGDIHDIGKNLVKAMLTANGWQVHDLGSDVPCQTFLEAQKDFQADIVGLSSLMATSMMAMPEVIERLHSVFPDVKIMVGGAPLSPEVAKNFHADGYARDAVQAVKEAQRLFLHRPATPDPESDAWTG